MAYCTAEQYDFDKLLKALQKERVPAVYFAEVIHISVPGMPDTKVGSLLGFSLKLKDLSCNDRFASCVAFYSVVKSCNTKPFVAFWDFLTLPMRKIKEKH